jgi:tape measure domain-containing protein
MSDDLDVVIKVDAPGGSQVLDKLHGDMAKVEDAGPRVGKAVSAGMAQAAASTNTLSQAMQPAQGAFAQLATAIQREGTMLEAINKPLREHAEGMQTLDALYLKNKISAEQYEAQIEKLNATIGKTPKEGGGVVEGAGRAVAGQFGAAGGLVGGLASSGVIEAAGAIEAGKAVLELNDDYVKLQNSAMRLSDGVRATSDVLSQQYDLAGDLHGSLEQTIELSNVVRERTDDLNLSFDQQARITKSVGEAAQYSGQSLQGATEVINRVSFALDSGLPAGRQMRELFMQYPLLADAMREHFGAATGTIITMAQKGQLSAKDFFDAMVNGGDGIDKKFATVGVTMGQHLQHLKDGFVETYGGLDLLYNAMYPFQQQQERATAALNAHTQELMKDVDAMQTNLQAIDALKLAHSDFVETLTREGQALTDGQKLLDDNASAYDKAVAKVAGYGAAVQKLRDFTSKLQQDGAKGDMTRFMAAGDVSVLRGYQDSQQELTDSVSRYGAVLSEIHKHEAERQRGIEDLNGALKAHLITQTEYGEEIKKYTKDVTSAAEAEKRRMAAAEEAIKRDVELYDKRAAAAKREKEIADKESSNVYGDKAQGEQEKLYSKFVDVTEPVRALKEYDAAIEVVNQAKHEGVITDAQAAQGLIDIREKYSLVKTGAEEYAKGAKELGEELGAGLLSLQGYNKALDDLAVKTGQATFGQALGVQFRQMAQEAGNAATSAKTIIGGVNQLNEQIVSGITTGKGFDPGKILESVSGGFMKQGLQSVEGKLFGNLFGGDSGDPNAKFSSAVDRFAAAVGGMGGAGVGGKGIAGGALGGALGGGGSGSGDATSATGGYDGGTQSIPAWNQGGNDPDVAARIFSGGGFGRSGGPIVVQVAPAQVTAVFSADMRGQIDDYMASGAGDRHFVAMANRRRGALKAALR